MSKPPQIEQFFAKAIFTKENEVGQVEESHSQRQIPISAATKAEAEKIAWEEFEQQAKTEGKTIKHVNVSTRAEELARQRRENVRTFAGYLFLFAFGFLVMLGLQWHFVASWRSYYSHFPFPGYAAAMKAGDIPPFFTTSTRSDLVTKITLALVAVVAMLVSRASSRVSILRLGFVLWAAVTASATVIVVASPQLREDTTSWPIDFIAVAYSTGQPLVLGIGIVLLVRWFLRRRSKQAL